MARRKHRVDKIREKSCVSQESALREEGKNRGHCKKQKISPDSDEELRRKSEWETHEEKDPQTYLPSKDSTVEKGNKRR